MDREITLEERKSIQLKMLNEIDSFCCNNGIRYSLSYGTLIGAIRHKGFIPWDDDVDIMMPLPDMLRFKKEFYSKNIYFCDVDTESHYEFAFPRLSHNLTYSKRGPICRSYGVNIDLYTIISLPENAKEYDTFFSTAKNLFSKRMKFISWRSRIINRLPLTTIPGFDKSIRQYRDFLYNNCPEYGSTNLYYVIGGALEDNEIKLCTYDFDLFEKNTITVPFENMDLRSISDYQNFLTHYYGDYMQLPPEEERHPYHGGHFFWKNK